LISQFKISCTNVYRRNSFWEIVTYIIGNGFGNLTLVTLTFDPVTPKSKGFLSYPGWIRGPSLGMADQGLLELLVGNSLGTFDPGDLDL